MLGNGSYASVQTYKNNHSNKEYAVKVINSSFACFLINFVGNLLSTLLSKCLNKQFFNVDFSLLLFRSLKRIMEDLGAKFSKKLRYSICAKDMITSCSFMSILKSRSGSTLCLIKCKEVRKILHISF